MTLDEYLDRAKARHDIPSDLQLTKTLKVGASTVNHWRTKRQWPTDAVMVRLADLAGVDSGQALLDLNAWRTDEKTRSIYEELRIRVTGSRLKAALLISKGQDFEKAILSSAEAFGLDAPGMEQTARRAVREIEKRERQARNRRIMMLVSEGWHDQAIGDRYHLHPKHVNRIIRQERKAR